MINEIIKALLNSKRFGKIFFKQIKDSQFDEPYSTIIKYYKMFIKKYKQLPTESSLLSYLKEVLDEDLKEDVLAAFKEICETIIDDNLDVIIEMTKEFLIKKNLQNFLIDTVDNIENNKATLGEIKKRLLSCDVSTIAKDKVTSVNEYFNEAKEWILSDKQVSSSGFEWIDSVLSGGWHKNMVNVICSVANAGKTQFLITLAYNLAKSGKNGIFISYELDKNQIYQRFLACASETNIPDLKNNLGLCKTRINMKGKLSLEHLPDGSDTTLIEDVIEEYTSNVDTNLDFVIIDYIGCCSSLQVDSKAGLYERYGAVISDFKQIADKNDITLLTAHQLNRSGYNNTNVDMSSIGDSMKIAHKADNVFFLTVEDDKSDQERILKLKLDKTRVSGANGSFNYFLSNKPKQRIYDCHDEINDYLNGSEYAKKRQKSVENKKRY